VFPPRFFHAVLSRFGDDAVLLIVRRGSTPVAGALAFLFGDTVMPYYVGSHRAFFRYAINDFLYVPAPIQAGVVVPRLDSPSYNGPIQGALLLFKLTVQTLYNRPLAFHIESTTGGADGIINLDV